MPILFSSGGRCLITRFPLITRFLGPAGGAVLAIALAGLAGTLLSTTTSRPASAATSASASPINRDAGYFGVNAERPNEDVYNSDVLAPAGQLSGSYTVEATVCVSQTAAARGTAGILFGWDGQTANFSYFGIYPNEDKWRFYSPGLAYPVEGDYAFDLAPQSYHLKVSVTGSSASLYINGALAGSQVPVATAAGRAGIYIKSSDSSFSDLRINGVLQQPAQWQPSHPIAWQQLDTYTVRGNVLLDAATLSSPELSPELEERFSRIEEMGATSLRFHLSWAEVQAQSAGQAYDWRYSDAFAIAAHRHNLQLIPVLIYAPNWAVDPAFRASSFYQAYPPVDSNGQFDTTYFRQFTTAATDRYRPGGGLAAAQGWSAADAGQAAAFEIGAEFNLGTLYEYHAAGAGQPGQWAAVGAGWMGTLAQYVDLLKAGHDAVKGSCPSCLVLNGAPADNSITNYYIGDNSKRYDGYVPYLDTTRLHNPDGSLAWRQTVWQGVDDLYSEIERRPAPDNVPGAYFDVLNVHSFMWKGYGAEWPVTQDRYVNCSYYSEQCWQEWYSKRLSEVVQVMHAHNDERAVWLTETGFPSARPGNDTAGFLGFLSPDKQALSVNAAYSSAAAYPEVTKVFWWQAYDSYSYTGNLGLMDDNMSTKPSYDRYQWLTGRRLDLTSGFDFTWYDNVGAQNWVLMANPASAPDNASFTLAIAGQERGLPWIGDLPPGQLPPGNVVYAIFPGVRGGPVTGTYTAASPAFASQRILWAGSSLEEVPATESARLSNHFYWPWYDQVTPGFQDWVLVSNPGAQPVYYRISIGGRQVRTGLLQPGETFTPQFPGTQGGPVEVRAWRDGLDGVDPAEMIASQRVLMGNGSAFNEVPGMAAEDLDSDYVWTWYDMKSPGASNWVLVANPGTTPIWYEISIGGHSVRNGGPVYPGQYETPSFAGTQGGPVELKTFSDTGHSVPANSIASQRSLWGGSFEEVPGYRVSALASTYHWTWYDESENYVNNWILVANLSSGQIWYQVLIAGQPMGGCRSVPPGQNDTPRFTTFSGGPVEVIAFRDPDCATLASPGSMLASQRVLWDGHFNEVPGISLP